MKSRHPYRVFLCYAHENEGKLRKIVEHLKELGLVPRWSGTLRAGTSFLSEIKVGIARSHVFMPILTRKATKRPWVHQEIGFALGASIPTIPLGIGDLPTGMANELQAVRLEKDLSDLRAQLTLDVITAAVMFGQERGKAQYEVAPLQEDRTHMIVAAAKWLLENRYVERVRQWGAFTSFSLPSESQGEEWWEWCDGKGQPRGDVLRRELHRERHLLEQHSNGAGCDLIIEPSPPYGKRGESAKRARLEILVEFLENAGNNVRAVVVPDEKRMRGNLLIMGDWFTAESVTPLPGRGYQQTLATWHAPSVLARIEEFDQTFDRLHGTFAKPGVPSRVTAVRELRAIIDQLPAFRS